jgi:hypothetical protein
MKRLLHPPTGERMSAARLQGRKLMHVRCSSTRAAPTTSSSRSNYGESYERNVGMESPLKLARGLNGLWTKGGLMYAIPLR